MSVGTQTRLRTKMQTEVVCRKSEVLDFVARQRGRSRTREQMETILLPKNEAASPSLQRGCRMPFLTTKELTYDSTMWLCTLVLCVRVVWLLVWCHTPLGFQATCCLSVLFLKQTERISQLYSLIFRLARRLLACHCITALGGDWGSASRISHAWFSPARQVEWGKQYYCEHRDIPGVGLGWGGGVDCCLSVVLVCSGRFRCAVVLLLLVYFILENAEDIEWAIKFTCAHVTVFAGDDWIQVTLLSMSSFVKFSSLWRHWGIMCPEISIEVLYVPVP